MQYLSVRGARQHNLKNVDCDIPRNQLVVLTGPSGSGKSSLAFDTIYAEGQRRYVESLSAYARQFLDQLPKPLVESIEGLSPSIAIEQKGLGKNPRSTVGTVTEILDYLRLLFARVGRPHCPISGEPLYAYTVQEIVDELMALPEGSKLLILGPKLRKESESRCSEEIRALKREGYVRVRLNGSVEDLGEIGALNARGKYDLEVVVDRLVVRDSIKTRLSDSVELALSLGSGTMLVDRMDDSAPAVYSEKLVSWEHGVVLPSVEPKLFSFNNPHGACPTCKGIGSKDAIAAERLISDGTLSLREGALPCLGLRGSPAFTSALSELQSCFGSECDPDKAFENLPGDIREAIFFGREKKKKSESFEGWVPRLQRYIDEDLLSDQDEEGGFTADQLSRTIVHQICDDCLGSRLRKEALSITIAGKNIAALSRASLEDLQALLVDMSKSDSLSKKELSIAEPLLEAMIKRLGFLLDVGLSYLSLDRSSNTLSGGEGQRIRLATQIGAALVGVLYVLDEPTVGLHARDTDRLLDALDRLVKKDNTVLVVEHDRDVIRAANYVFDIGPGAGSMGGYIIAQGTPEEIIENSSSLTGKFLDENYRLPRSSKQKKPGRKKIVLEGASSNNLKNITVEFPIGLMTAVTGVSGSGKSSLVVDTLLNAAKSELYGSSKMVGSTKSIRGLEHVDKVISIDQGAIGKTPRSNPATYTGIFTHLRDLYAGLPDARARGYKAGRFSFNVKGGRCEACQGDGLLRVEMHFLPDVYVNCDVCDGARYNRETLEIKYRALSIAESLKLRVSDALPIFEAVPKIRQKLEALQKVGLGYLELGQSATTLSGGEAQRVKLATELSKTATGQTLYILDEPTTGLHFQDIEMLMLALAQLKDAGNTVILIEHNLDVVETCDWVIDIGPEAGVRGGELVYAGTPELLHKCPASQTGRYMHQAKSFRGPAKNKAETKTATAKSSAIKSSAVKKSVAKRPAAKKAKE